MPELPEVETIKRQLESVLVGQRVQVVEVMSEKSFSGYKDMLVGMEVVGVRRRGKGLVVDFRGIPTLCPFVRGDQLNDNSDNEIHRFALDDGKGGAKDSIPAYSGTGALLQNDRERDQIIRDASNDDGYSLVIHLKMTGQLIYEVEDSNHSQLSPKEVVAGTLSNPPLLTERNQTRIVGGHPTEDFVRSLPSKHTRVVIRFKKQKVNSEEDNLIHYLGSVNNADLSTSQLMRGSPLTGETELCGVLYFNDQRKFGWMKMVKTEDVEKLDFVSKLGPEPWEINNEEFYKGLQKSKKPIKVRIMDQDFVAGVGNIYANDALWEARIDPNRKANRLSWDEASLLLVKIKLVLEQGIYYGGATAPDKKYMDLSGVGGRYQEYFRVYERAGESCKRKDCIGVIKKMKLGGRGTYWCEECQK